MMVGAVTDGGVSMMPNQPASPIAVIADRPITISVATVPPIERSRTPMTSSSTPYISGTRVPMSPSADSEKAWFSATEPVIATRTSGWSVWNASAIRRACAIASETSVSEVSGSVTVTLTARVRASGAIRRSRISGSASAASRMRARSAASSGLSAGTRSCTARSSPSAVLFWKLVMLSTRVA